MLTGFCGLYGVVQVEDALQTRAGTGRLRRLSAETPALSSMWPIALATADGRSSAGFRPPALGRKKLRRCEVVLGEAPYYSPNGMSFPSRSFDGSFLRTLKIGSGPDVHFDGPKMDQKGFGCLKRT